MTDFSIFNSKKNTEKTEPIRPFQQKQPHTDPHGIFTGVELQNLYDLNVYYNVQVRHNILHVGPPLAGTIVKCTAEFSTTVLQLAPSNEPDMSCV